MSHFLIKPTKKTILSFITLLFSLIICLILSSGWFNIFAVEFVQRITGKVLRDPYKWSRIVYNCVHIPLFISLILFFLKFTSAGNSICQTKKEIYKNFKEFFKQKNTIFLSSILTLFFFIAYYKIINADFYYQDDMARNIGADDSGWMSYGRYVSEFLSVLIHGSFPLTDIAPLSQIISILIFTFTVIIISYIVMGTEIKPLPVLGLTIVFISPFFSQCFSYRYDNPYMTLSVLFAVLPFLFKDDIKTFIYTSIVFLILSCMSYQAGTSVYIVLCMYIVLKKMINNDKKNLISFIICSIISFAVALVIYQLLFNCSGNSHFEQTINQGLASTGFSVSMIIPNLKKYTSIVLRNFGGLLFKLCFVATLMFFVIFNIIKSKNNKIIATACVIFFLIAGFVLSLGSYLIFDISILFPRVFMGFNCFSALIIFDTISLIFSNTQTYKKILLAPSLLCIYLSTAFLYTYGNCLTQQKDYSDFRMHALIYDLSDIVPSKTEGLTISVKGTSGFCKAFDNARKQYPILNSLLMPFPGSNMWDKDYAYKFNFIFEDANLDSIPTDFELLKDSKLHVIYASADKKTYYVELKNE